MSERRGVLVGRSLVGPAGYAVEAVATFALASIVAMAIGYGVSLVPAFYVAVAVGCLALAVCIKDRLYLFGAVSVFYLVLFHQVPPLADVGGFTLRVDDVLFLGLAVDSIMRLSRVYVPAEVQSRLLGILFPVAIFLGYIGMSLFLVARWHPGELGMALASVFRLVVTACFTIIAYTTFTTEVRLKRFLSFLVLLSALSIALGGYEFRSASGIHYGGRASSFLGPNPLGILSGLLFLLGLVQYRRRIFDVRVAHWPLLCLGLIGLFLSKSISSTLATLATGCLYYLVHTRRDFLAVVRVGLGAAAAIMLFIILFFSLRPSEAQSFLALEGGSFTHRFILARAGLEIFKGNQVWGVGWGMSSLPEVIGSTDMGMTLRSIFLGVPEHLIPDGKGTSVHNMYVQFLAELGVVGMGLFLWLVVQIGSVARKVLAESADYAQLHGYGEYFSFGLMFLLVWWNTNPLFGGQIESFLAFVFLGGLAAVSNISKRLTPSQ